MASGLVRHGRPAVVPTPTAADQATPRQYVDDGLALKANDADVVHDTGNETIAGSKTIDAGAGNQWIFNQPPQVAEGNLASQPVRRDDTRLTDARTPTAHNHSASEITTGRLSAARLPLAMGEISAGGPGSGTIATDANLGNIRNYTANGDITISEPTNGTDGQIIQYAVLASGGARTITFDAGVDRLTGISVGPTSIPSGEICRFAMRRCDLISGWIVEAFGVTQ